MSKLRLSVVVFFAIAVVSARAAQYDVPGDYATLAAALQSTLSNDTIDVYQPETLSGTTVTGKVITFHNVNVAIQNCVFTNGGVRILATNTASVTATVSNNTFRQLRQEGIYVCSDDSGSCVANVGGNNVNGSVSNNTWPAIYLVAHGSSTLNLGVRNNTVSNLVDTDAIVVRAIDGGANITGSLVQNTVGSAGTNAYDRGIWVDVVPKPNVVTHGSLTVSDNIVRSTGGSGIKIRVMDDAGRTHWCGVDFTVYNNQCNNNAIAGNGEAALFAEVGTTPGSTADAWLDLNGNTVDAKGYKLAHGDGQNTGRFVVPGHPVLLVSTQSWNAKYHVELYNTGVATVFGTVTVGGGQRDMITGLEDTQRVCNVLTNDWDFHGLQATLRIIGVAQGTNGTVTIGGTATNITYTPVTNYFGGDSFTYTVANTAGGNDWTGSATVTMTVLPVNDPPSYTQGADQDVNEDSGLKSIANWATAISLGPANESAQTLTFVTTNTSQSLFSAQPAVSPAGTLTFTPAANLSGTATVRVWCVDNGGTTNGGRNTSTTQSFAIVVNPVNDAPTFTSGANQSVPEDAGPQIVGWATGISRGPADEFGQSVDFIVTNDNPTLFSTQPSITSVGTLAYASAANSNGTATVTVRLHDDGGVARGGEDTSAPVNFTVTITPVNDAPIALALSANEVPENQPTGTTIGVLSTTDIDVGDTFQYALVPGAGSTDNALFKIEAHTLKTATVLDYEAQTNRSIRVRTLDSGLATFDQVFTIDVLNRPDPQIINFSNPGTQFFTNVVHLAASASSALPVSFSLLSGPGLLNGTNLTFSGVGTVSIVASQAGNAEWLTAPEVTNTFDVLKVTQAALVFTPASPQTYNTTNTLTTSGGSGTGDVSFSVLSGPGTLTSPTELTMTSGTGSVLVVATRAEDDVYYAQSVTSAVAAAKAGQTINFPPIPDQRTTNRYGLAATASSGLGVTFAVASGPGSIADSTNLTFVTWGPAAIAAIQAGNANYNEQIVTNTFFVRLSPQEPLIFSPPSPQKYGTTNQLTATGGSGSGVLSFGVSGGPGVLVGGSNLVVTSGAGTVLVAAWKPSDGIYSEQIVTAQVACAKADQAITFPAIGDQLTTNRIGLAASSSSGLGVSFSVLSSPASISGGTNLTFTGTGMVSIVASQPGGSEWLAAPNVTNTFSVSKATQFALTFTPESPQIFNTTNGLSAGGGQSSGGWTFSVESGTAEIVAGTNLWMRTGTGSATVRATKAGDANWSEAYVEATVNAAKAGQAITFGVIADQLTTNRYELTAGADSGLGVLFGVLSGPATIAGETNLFFTGAGSVSIVASQGGNADWTGASNVTNTFTVTKTAQEAFTFTPASPQTYDTTNTLTTSGGSGTGDVSYAVLSGPGEIIGMSALKMQAGTGSVSVVATKASDDMFNALSVTSVVAAAKAQQSIDFPAIADQLTTGHYQLTASAFSGLPVIFAVQSGPAVIAYGTNLTFTTAGTVSVAASQVGDDNWAVAPSVTNTFTVTKAGQAALVFAPVSPQTYNTTNALSATGGSGTGAVSFAVVSGAAQIVGVDGLRMTAGTGFVNVVAMKASDDLYDGQSVTAAVAAAKAGQAIAFPAIANQLTTGHYQLTASASSGLSVIFAVQNGPAVITSGTNLTFTTAGAVSIVASQAGDDNWVAAPAVTNRFNVSRAVAAVSLSGLSQSYNGSARVVTATTVPAGLAVRLTYNGSATAPTDVGSYSVTGVVNDLVYTGKVAGALTVTKGNQTIAFALIVNQRPNNVVHLSATASSGLPVSFAVVSGPAMLANGTNLSFSGNGEVTVRASQAGNANWSAASAVQSFRVASSGILDFDGDGITDIGVYRSSSNFWFAFQSTDGALTPFAFGTRNDIAVPADYDGDGFCDVAVFRPSTATWYIFGSATGGWSPMRYGIVGDLPIPADYDGDGKADFAVLRPASMTWYIFGSSAGSLAPFVYGISGDRPIPADYDRDGRADPAVFRASTATWYIYGTTSGAFTPFQYGTSVDMPVPGDYDGDGRIDCGVFRPSNGTWYIYKTTAGPMPPFVYGTVGDVPMIFPRR